MVRRIKQGVATAFVFAEVGDFENTVYVNLNKILQTFTKRICATLSRVPKIAIPDAFNPFTAKRNFTLWAEFFFQKKRHI